MGLLNSNSLNQWFTKTIPQNARNLWGEIKQAPQDMRNMFTPETYKKTMDAYHKPQGNIDKDKAIAMAMDFLQTTNPVAGIGGMFIGKGAKTWDVLKAQEAEEMLAKGIDPREVWKKTGTARFVDGQLRQEIPDNAARMVDPDTPGLLDKMIASDPSSKNLKGIPQAMALEDVFRHPNLDMAYFPTREDAPSVMFDSLGSTRGNYSDGFVTLNNANILDSEPVQRSTMLHELQHAIQQREGWAKGGSPSQLSDISSTLAGNALNKLDDVSAKHPALRKAYNLMNQTQDALLEKYKLSRFNPSDMTFNQRAGMDFMKKATPEDKAVWKEANDAYWQVLKDSPVQKEFADAAVKAWQSNIPIDPHTAYRRLAGEAESRLTQSRMNLDAQQRLQNYPYDIGQYGLDVPIDQLIVRGLLK